MCVFPVISSDHLQFLKLLFSIHDTRDTDHLVIVIGETPITEILMATRARITQRHNIHPNGMIELINELMEIDFDNFFPFSIIPEFKNSSGYPKTDKKIRGQLERVKMPPFVNKKKTNPRHRGMICR